MSPRWAVAACSVCLRSCRAVGAGPAHHKPCVRQQRIDPSQVHVRWCGHESRTGIHRGARRHQEPRAHRRRSGRAEEPESGRDVRALADLGYRPDEQGLCRRRRQRRHQRDRRAGFMGPCPPDREHRYFFKLYALDTRLTGAKIASKADLERAMAGTHRRADRTDRAVPEAVAANARARDSGREREAESLRLHC